VPTHHSGGSDRSGRDAQRLAARAEIQEIVVDRDATIDVRITTGVAV